LNSSVEVIESFLRFIVPAALALFVASRMDRMLLARGLFPPGFRESWRRGLAIGLITLILWIGIFSSLGTIGKAVEQPDLRSIPTPQLFLLHGLLLLALGLWFLLGYAGVRPSPPRPASPASLASVPPSPGEGGEDLPETAPEPVLETMAGPPPISLGRQFLAQFGLLVPNVPREIGLGLLLGVGAWGAVLIAAIVIGLILVALGGEQALPKQPPTLIPFLAALPIGLRLAISLSAGVVEELFFRGFLQPRIGIALSTLLFVFAHFSYGQPLMLAGIAILSLIYAFLVRWRQTIWPAIAAHALFDSIQLLVIIPMALRFMEKEGLKTAAFLFGN
jgi:membrane protease YdiL (CAAX protease family)